MELKNKVAIVTGASSGIGLATAKLLSKNGAKVALVSRSKEKLKEISKTLPHSFVVQVDMIKENEIRDMVKKVLEHYGKIDILINNAGQGYDAFVEEVNLNTYHKIFDLDVVGPLIAMQEVIPIMRKLGGGSIVNISSGTALMALSGMSPYSSLKRALVGLSLTAREELKEDNITVTVIYPYITLTNFEKNTIKENNLDQGESEEINSDLPPADTPEFVAEKILEGIKTGEAEIYVHDWMKKM